MPAADLALIDRAAGVRGRSRTDFVRDAAVRAAEDVLMKSGLVRMSAEGGRVHGGAVGTGHAGPPAMVDVLRRPSPWERD